MDLEESSFLTESEKEHQYDTDKKNRKEKELVNEENTVLKEESDIQYNMVDK
jgi:hypothetical protein